MDVDHFLVSYLANKSYSLVRKHFGQTINYCPSLFFLSHELFCHWGLRFYWIESCERA